MSKNENAVKYIIDLIKGLDATAEVVVNQPEGYTYSFHVRIQGQKQNITFDRDLMDDFEIAINDSKGSNYYYSLENTINFKVYISLGQKGYIPNFIVSSKILNEQRDWKRDYRCRVFLDQLLYEKLYEGLKKLRNFLEEIIGEHKKHRIDFKEFEEDKKKVDNLIEHYEQHDSSLEQDVVTLDHLSFLKAALVCEILEKEKIKKQTSLPARSIKKIDEEIYSMVSDLRKGVFLEAKLPDCIHEYADRIQGDAKKMPKSKSQDLEIFKNWVPFGSNKTVFLAHRFKEKQLIDSIKTELAKSGFQFKEGRVEDLGYITEDILNKIKESGFFLALVTPYKEYKTEKFSTSSWILMEIGAAIAYGRKILILAENSVDQEEYKDKLQRDCQYENFTRDNFLEKLNTVIHRLIKEGGKINK